jgi:hypothetical protein
VVPPLFQGFSEVVCSRPESQSERTRLCNAG